jgi:hypothetical protein
LPPAPSPAKMTRLEDFYRAILRGDVISNDQQYAGAE